MSGGARAARARPTGAVAQGLRRPPPPRSRAAGPSRTPFSLTSVPVRPEADADRSTDVSELAAVGSGPALAVGSADDPAEAEADRAADRVMAGGQTRIASRGAQPLQRKCAECEEADEAEENEPVRRSPVGTSAAGATGPLAPPVVQSALSGGGRPLDAALRADLEPRLGADFARVRVHTDSAADLAARSIGARAFTWKDRIAFAAGEYAPETRSGRRLLAHELAHVVQGGGAVRRQSVGTEPPAAAPPGSGGGARAPPNPPPTLTRAQEVALSRRSPGEFSVTGPPVVITLFNFAINDSALKDRHREALTAFGAMLRSYGGGQGIVIRSSGHADESGEPEINDPLSARRASAVAAFLTRESGVGIVTEAFGENQPADVTGTPEGRSRNRRVELRIVPTGQDPVVREDDPPDRTDEPPRRDDDPPPGRRDPPPRRDEQEDTRRWVCARHPVWCALFGALIALLILCLLRPSWCLPRPRVPGPPPNPPGRPPRRRACVNLSSIDLPTGTLRPNPAMPAYLHTPFVMNMDFTNDPATGCLCECGEYRQFVRGYFRTIEMNGNRTDRRHVLAGGAVMSESLFQEDGGNGAPGYGHRNSVYRVNPNRDPDEQEGYNDRFLPDRANGCQYRGTDNPGVMVGDGYPPGATVIVHLDFMALPVDTCQPGPARPLTAPFFWQVRGQYTRSPPRPPTPPVRPPSGGSGPGGTGSVTPVAPRPFQGSVGGPAPMLRYAGGLRGAGVGPATIRFQFDRNGTTYEAAVPVIVTAEDATTITITPANRTLINIAPPSDPTPAILIVPGRTAVLHKSGL